MNEPRLNLPELTVSELSAALKRTIEDSYGYVRVRGELGKVSYHSNGHVYFDLKDDRACIAGVIWRSTSARIKLKLEAGLEVVITGRVTTYPGRSQYQIVVETLEPAGLGALMALLEERKRRLAAEGLFNEARKQLLPYIPAVIGVITSPTGAVIRDILHRLAERFPRRVLVWPVKVQGDGSAAEVAAAIAGFNALPERGALPRPDLIIVARGGGSLEDLWSFNEEVVVRAASQSLVPLISAVGHETDVTLLDFVADRRAPTPTAAAEIAVPVRSELMVDVGNLSRRALACWRRNQEARRSELRSAARALPDVDEVLAPAGSARIFCATMSSVGASGTPVLRSVFAPALPRTSRRIAPASRANTSRSAVWQSVPGLRWTTTWRRAGRDANATPSCLPPSPIAAFWLAALRWCATKRAGLCALLPRSRLARQSGSNSPTAVPARESKPCRRRRVRSRRGRAVGAIRARVKAACSNANRRRSDRHDNARLRFTSA
jgi:exodeoxyribonuclease VII large subunit